eukprot:m.136753 g.136753  ORF g.136753 m.136753 type:complete len:96 (+) comp10882_c0_seq1:149-436(+)
MTGISRHKKEKKNQTHEPSQRISSMVFIKGGKTIINGNKHGHKFISKNKMLMLKINEKKNIHTSIIEHYFSSVQKMPFLKRGECKISNTKKIRGR